jgi:DNA integrity scanning protein DisA with diadenylate cyclase activity
VNKVTEAILTNTLTLARSVSAKAVVFDSEVFESKADLDAALALLDHAAVVTIRAKTAVADAMRSDAGQEGDQGDTGEGRLPAVTHLIVPNVPMSRTGQIKVAVLVGVAEQVFGRGDLIVCLSGVQSSNRLDMVTVLKVGDEPEFFLTDEQHPLPPDVDPSVFERVLSIASELAVEGRESRSVGALFVLGDSDAVLDKSRQLVINPFHGYPEADRNILTGNLDETIKEFANIDGAFIIRGDGVVLAAGRYLMPQGKSSESVRSGLGSRHESAAAITRATDAVAVVLSQSTSTITVFNSGRIMTELERIKGSAASQGLRFKRLTDGPD